MDILAGLAVYAGDNPKAQLFIFFFGGLKFFL